MNPYCVTVEWVDEHPDAAEELIRKLLAENDELCHQVIRLKSDKDALLESTALAVGVERHEWRRVDGTTLSPVELTVAYRFSPESIYSLRMHRTELLSMVAHNIARMITMKIIDGGFQGER